jgi:hypothetical protein
VPRKFLVDIVQPNVTDFTSNYADMRMAYNAVAAVDSLAAHIFEWCLVNTPTRISGVANDGQYRAELAKGSPEFGLLRDIAKAQKHVRLSNFKPQVSSASQVSSQALGWDEAPWGEGRWGGVQQVVVETNSGRVRVVEALVIAALKFLEDEMTALGI